MRSGAAIMKYDVGAPFFSDPYFGFALNSQILINLRDDAFYTALKDNTSPVRILDTGELRAELDVLSQLPDPTKAGADKPSVIVRQFRQALDLVDSNIKSGKPFTDGSGNGQRAMDLILPLLITQKANVAFSGAFQVACASYTPAPRATDKPQAFKSKTKAECATLDKAVGHFMPMALFVLALTDDDTYAVVGKPDAEFYIDTAALRSDLTVIATLPDIAEETALYGGTLSQLLPPFRQSLDQIDANVKAGSTPFTDGSDNGQKVLDLARPLLAHTQLLLATSSDVCK